jgi:hypothetical protein
LALTIVTQLNIISTRNPSFWWYFSKKTAPPPSLKLAIPVSFFLLASTFIAVYWPTSVKPDGGRGFMDGSGWATVGLTWFYCILWFTLADAAKTGLQWIFRKHTEVELHVKEHGGVEPAWAKAISAPSVYTQKLVDSVASIFKKKEKEEEPEAVVQPQMSQNDKGDTLVSFTRRSHSIRRSSKSFRDAHLQRGSSHLAA